MGLSERSSQRLACCSIARTMSVLTESVSTQRLPSGMCDSTELATAIVILSGKQRHTQSLDWISWTISADGAVTCAWIYLHSPSLAADSAAAGRESAIVTRTP